MNVKWYLVRRWFYWLSVAAGAVLVYYQVLPPEALAVWLPVILAALNTNPPATPDEIGQDT